MRIMLQNHTYYPIVGGIENYLYHVSKTLKEMGHQPVILCGKHDQKFPEYENCDGIEIIRHPYYEIPKQLLFIKPKIIASKLKDFVLKHVENVDLVISRYPYYSFATCSLDSNIPIFYLPATVFWKYIKKSSENLGVKARIFNYLWKPIFNEMEAESISRSDKVITLSRNVSNSLARYYHLEPNSFLVNKPGVDINRFRPSENGLEDREEFDIPKDSLVILYVGRLSREKNVERLIMTFGRLQRRDIHLLIVGDGPCRVRLEQLREELGMIRQITLLGMRTDVERFYSMADIFVLPSKYEGFGQVILEAMAAGLPSIAFKKFMPAYEVASEEIIADGLTGFCVDPYNEDEFHERLLYLIEHGDVRRAMGKAAREVCEKDYTWEGHVRRLLDLLKS
jgi:1,2-diacylglycerol 3-alpha-glucosyltransferase